MSIEDIIADINSRVKQNVENIPQEIEPVNYPSIMEDYLFHKNVQAKPDSPIRREITELEQINKAFNKLVAKDGEGQLTDNFRTESNQETRPVAARSIAQTLNSYKRYASILQASS